MTKIAISALNAEGNPYSFGEVVVRLVDAGSGGAVDGGVIVAPRPVRLDEDGEAQVDLTPTADVDPAGTCYAFTVVGVAPTVVRYLTVPAPNIVGPSEVPYPWNDPDLQVVFAEPPTFVPAPSTGTVGEVLTLVDDGDGKRYELRPPTGGAGATSAALLSPLTASGAPTNAGPSTLLGFGSDPTPYAGGPLSAETIPAYGWEGLKVAGQMRSTVGGSFPSAGFEFSVDMYVARRTYLATAGWIEAMTVHSYTLGDSNELHDWLEIAAVHDDPDLDTLSVGVDLRLNGEATEYTYISTERPLRFNTWQHLRMTLDPATAEITVTVDGDEIESGVPARIGDPMDTPTTPCTLSTPDAGVDILLARGAVIIGKVTLNEYGDPPVTLCDPADGTDGALSFTSAGRDWVTWGGRVAAPFPTRRLMAGPWSNPSTSFDIGADDSFTWVITDVLLGYDFEFFDGVFLWGRNAMAVFGAGVGWGMLLAPVVGVPFGFGVTSSGAGGAALAQADAVPQGRCTIAAVLDRDTDELRLYVATATGLELLDTVDASGVGAIAPSADTQAQTVPEMGGHYLTYRRALTPTEITYLALEGNGAGPEVATTDASELISGTLPFARLPIGTTSTTVPAGNDSRFSDARTPTAHKTSHATGGSDALAPSDIGAVPTSRQIAGLDLTADRNAAALRTALGLWTPIANETLGSASGSRTYDITGYRFVRIIMAARSNRNGTIDTIRLRFNGDTSSNYSTNTGSFTTFISAFDISGENMNTDRSGYVVVQFAYMAGAWLTGTAMGTGPSSTATTAANSLSTGFAWKGATSAAPTSIEVYTAIGQFVAGSSFLVEGRP